ncbi:hypothetical protein FOZ60_001140 [Perkinsus olseni]|uniref:Uncharacterized protein n=1 Tax=Perkinsus olseni TaxID=32597 RepID=A0A7J6P104_PEROL|nr:hypothetical protein FOZ60_001140 [Perkinsus olseni]
MWLKSVGRNYGPARSLKRKAGDSRAESELRPESVARLQSQFRAKYGMAIPGRFTVDAQILGKIKEGRTGAGCTVQLTECDEPGPLAGKRSRIVIDPHGACLTRFCLSAAMLGKMSPTEALVYMARLSELDEKTSVQAIKSADLGVRLEAVRGGGDDSDSLGRKLACGQADILAAAARLPVAPKVVPAQGVQLSSIALGH